MKRVILKFITLLFIFSFVFTQNATLWAMERPTKKKKPSKEAMLPKMPTEIIMEIVKNLDEEAILHLYQTSPVFKKFLDVKRKAIKKRREISAAFLRRRRKGIKRMITKIREGKSIFAVPSWGEISEYEWRKTEESKWTEKQHLGFYLEAMLGETKQKWDSSERERWEDLEIENEYLDYLFYGRIGGVKRYLTLFKDKIIEYVKEYGEFGKKKRLMGKQEQDRQRYRDKLLECLQVQDSWYEEMLKRGY